ncbi:hypothetical protein HMSSN139_49810 [Paenibacillus sp. HMSSN-139]|nr:hypothetical protein HMSSN139_49810 [Paenibacillus sp. HMSSN-139]
MISPEVKEQFKAIVGDKWVLDRPAELYAYSYDATPMYQALPDAVVLPASTREVSGILQLADTHRIPVIPRGSGTNLAASAIPVHGGIVLNLNRMNQIHEIDTRNLTATVGPGVVTASLHQAVETLGLFYPPDPGSMRISTIGGNVSQGAGGDARTEIRRDQGLRDGP